MPSASGIPYNAGSRRACASVASSRPDGSWGDHRRCWTHFSSTPPCIRPGPLPDAQQSLGMGLFFYPRGGSARVATYLSRALDAYGWPVTLACGSIGEAGSIGNAATVFSGVDIVPAPYDDAIARWRRGEDPMDAPFPMHPSFEARPGVPDRAFPFVSPLQGERMAEAWAALSGRVASAVSGAVASPASSDAAA